MGHLYHGYVSRNQRVIGEISRNYWDDVNRYSPVQRAGDRSWRILLLAPAGVTLSTIWIISLDITYIMMQPQKTSVCCSMLQSDISCHAQRKLRTLVAELGSGFLAIPGRHKCYRPQCRRSMEPLCCRFVPYVRDGEWSWMMEILCEDIM
jgi:hypothetical protein